MVQSSTRHFLKKNHFLLHVKLFSSFLEDKSEKITSMKVHRRPMIGS